MEKNMGMEHREFKARRGINILERMLFLLIVPMVVFLLFADVSIRSMVDVSSSKLVKYQLMGMTYVMNLDLSNISAEKMQYRDGSLYKGEVNLSENRSFIDQFAENTGVDITVFWDSQSVSTSIKDDSGTPLTFSMDKQVKEDNLGEGFFLSSVKIGNEKHFGYFSSLEAEGGEAVLMTSIPVKLVTSSYWKRLTNARLFMVILMVLFCAIIIVTVYKLVRAIVEVVHNLNRVADGELNFVLPAHLLNRGDEVGRIANAIGSLVQGFAQILNNINNSMTELDSFSAEFKNNFDVIADSIDNVNAAVDEMAKGSVHQAEDTQTVSDSLEIMSDAITKTTDGVDALSESADKMKQNNDMAGHTLQELIDISTRTQTSIDEVQNQTNLTNQSALDIRSATDIIADIASQTNMLSLNASIEAARAGEQGKGFAVVAEEIRKLAEQSSDSASHIREIVNTLISNSDHSVEIMNGVVDEIHIQYDKLDVTRNAFKQLDEEVKQVVREIEMITGEIANIAQSRTGVMDGIGSLSSVAEENAASSEQTSASMEQLSKILAECREAVAKLVTISDTLTQNAQKFKTK